MLTCAVLFIQCDLTAAFGTAYMTYWTYSAPRKRLFLDSRDIPPSHKEERMKILMLYPKFPDTFWSFKHAIKFVSKKASVPPLGLITISSMLPTDWQKKLVDLNIQPLKSSDIQWADMIFISAMNVQRSSVVEVVRQCKKYEKTIVAGGPLFTGEYDQFPEIDHFVLNEAEITLPPFLDDLSKGTLKKVYDTSDYADIQTTPVPDWSLLKLSAYESMAVQFSRGCPYDCEF